MSYNMADDFLKYVKKKHPQQATHSRTSNPQQWTGYTGSYRPEQRQQQTYLDDLSRDFMQNVHPGRGNRFGILSSQDDVDELSDFFESSGFLLSSISKNGYESRDFDMDTAFQDVNARGARVQSYMQRLDPTVRHAAENRMKMIQQAGEEYGWYNEFKTSDMYRKDNSPEMFGFYVQGKRRDQRELQAVEESRKADLAYQQYLESGEYKHRAGEYQPIPYVQQQSGAAPDRVPFEQTQEGKKASELKHKSDYWKGQVQGLKDEKIQLDDLMEYQSWPEEDKEIMERYAAHREGGAATIVGQSHWQFFLSQHDLKDLGEKYGYEKVQNIAESLTRSENAKAAQQIAEKTEQWTEHLPGAAVHSVLSVGANVANAVTGPMGYMYEALNRSDRYSTLDPNNAGNMFGKYAGGVRGNVGENLQEHGIVGEVGNILYQGGMSALDSIARIAVGGETMALGLAATGSFADTVSDASARGVDPFHATVMGIVDGGLEVITEKVSLDNLLDDVAKAPLNAKDIFKAAAIQGGIEVSEEEASLFGSLLAESIILRDQSEYNQTISKLMVENGMSLDDAKAVANRNIVHEAAVTALESFASGAMMSGGEQAIAKGQYNQAVRKSGKAVNKARGGSNALLAMADRLAEGSTPEAMTNVQQKAEAYRQAVDGKKPSGRKANMAAGELQVAISESIRAQGQSDLEKSLTRKGYTPESAKNMAEALVAYSNGDRLTGSQKALVASAKKSPKTMRAIADTINNPKSTAGHKNVELAAFQVAARSNSIEKAGQIADMAQNPEKYIQKDLADVDEYRIDADDIKFTEDGKAHVDGEAVEIQEITAASDGQMEVQLANGETVSADQIEHASEDDAIVYTAVARIAPDAKTANQLIADYRGGQVSARDYAMGIQQAYDFGAHNIRTDELLTADLASKLEPNQRLTAYKAGEAGGIRQLAMEKEIANKRTAPKGYKGGVDLSYVKTERSKWNAKQETAVQTWEKIAAITGTRFVAFESYEDGRKKGSRSFVNPVTGQVEQDAPHGFYKDGVVYVDLNAGNNAEGAMLWTTGHELAHHIRAWSPEKFKMLADVLVDFYGKTNRSVDEMVRDQIALAKRDNRTLTYDEAFEEFVADNLQAVLRDGKVVEMMTAVKAKDQTLWQKIKDFFTNLKEDLKKLIDAYKNSDPYTAEGKIAASSQALLDQLEPIFAEGLMEAGDNIATAPEAMDIEDSTEAVAVQETVKHSYRSLAEAAGFEAVEEDGSRYFTRGGQRVSEVTISDIDNSPIGAMINYSLEMGDLGKGKKAEDLAQRQKQMFVDVCNMAIQTNDFGMAMQFMGSAVFTGMKANADKQYNTTYDFPSICTKTQAIIDSMSARMVAMGRGLTEQEIVGLYNDTFASGNPVPCPECYVFSRWIGIGGLLDKISTFQKEYGDMKPEQVAARYRKMHAEIEEYVAEKNAEVAEWNKTHKGDDQKKEITFGRAKGSKASKLAKQHDDLVEKIEKDQDAGRTVKKSDLDKLKTLEGIMNTVNGLTWIEKVYFKDKAMTKKNPRAFVPNEILFDLNKGEMFAAQYPEAWGFRTTQGAGYGKAITPYAEARLGEGIMVTNNTSKTIKTKAKDKLNIKNPFLQQHGQMDKAAKRILATARQKQLNQAFIGGQRFQSTSDARYENASDYLLAALEMQATHGRVQVYTKVDGAVPAFANWGFSINQSLMPKGGGLDADGNVIDTDTGGMKKAVAVENRLKYETAGTITIGVNDNHIRAMFQQVIRDFIIPYHASGGKANLVTRFREIQEGKGNKTKMVRSTDYSRTQSDKILSDQVLEWMGKSQDEIDTIHKNRQARIDILTGGKPDMNVVTNNEYLKRLYEKTHGGPWNGVKLAKSKFEAQIYPNEFWDTSVDYEHSAKITSDYLAYCDSLGFLHRFSGMVPHQGKLIPAKGYNELGERVELTDLAYKYENGHITDEVEDFFWKTLTDRRMYDNSGNYLPQKVVTLNDTTPDTVRNFARNSAGRTYNKELAEQLAKEIVDKDYSDVDIGGKKAQKILGVKKSTRENLDEKQQKFYDYNQKQTEVGATLKTMTSGSPIKRSNYGVGKDIHGELYVHKQYADEIVPDEILQQAIHILDEKYPNFQYNAIRYNPKTEKVSFQEAPDFDTAREPVVGDYITVDTQAGTANKGHSNSIWHHKWNWVRNDYKGFDVEESWNWSKQWLSTLTETSDGINIGRWEAQLDRFGLPHDGKDNRPPQIKYSDRNLVSTPPVKPTSDKWQRGHNLQWFIDNNFPLFAPVTEEQRKANEEYYKALDPSKGQGTQNTFTRGTYKKVFQYIKANPEKFGSPRILDASAGKGHGTVMGKEDFGLDVHDLEPFPNKDYIPEFQYYRDLQDKIKAGEENQFDIIISNAVLNVMAQDNRDDVVAALNTFLKPGGQIFINVIGKDYDGANNATPETTRNAKGNPVGSVLLQEGINGGGREVYVWGSNSVQKVWSREELKAYLEDALPGYVIETPSKAWPKSGLSGTMVVATKPRGTMYSTRDPLQVRRSKADQRLIESYRDEIKDLNALVDLQTKDKQGRKVQPRQVSAVARSLIKNGKLTGDYHELADALKPFYDWIVTTDPYTVSSEDIQSKAANAVSWMASHSKAPEDVNRMDLLSDVYDSAWKVKTLLTPADIVADKNRTIAEKQAEIDRIKAAHEKTMQQTEKEWSDEVKAIRAMYQADRETVEKQLRADANARVEATAKKYQEARAKSTEGRHKTEMRHKLQHVVHDLDKLLRNGTKERHVPLSLQHPVALMLDMLDLDTVNADEKIDKITAEIAALQKERDAYQLKLAKADEEKKERILKSIEVREKKIANAYQRIANLRTRDEKMQTRLQELHEAYLKIQDDEDPSVRGSYDPVVDALIVQAEEAVGFTSLGDMSLSQMQKVYRLYRAMLKTVRDANKAHSERIKETITAMGKNVINELKMNVGTREGSFTALDFIRKFGWQNLRPAQFFKILGSPTLNTLYQEMRAGEDTFAQDIAGAKEFRAQIAAKYGSQDWDTEKLYTFEDATGQEFQLTLQQMMSIYAYRQRGAQALDHFSAGGIVLGPETKHKKKVGGINFDFKPTGSIAYRLPVETVGEIISTMESIDGVKGYVDEMQKYLSSVMGAKGNEVSRALYDMNLFNEEFYFPLRSATDWMARAKTSQEMKNAGFQSIKNKGMTKETKPKAGNPVVLAAFDSVWADHVDEMSIYHAMTLPMEDFGKVYAYHTGYEEEQTGAVIASIADAYGNEPNTYIEEFSRQLNGGVHVDVNANLLNRGVSKFKKAAVMASASVVAQQYSAIYRAMAVIDPRYFVASTPIRNHKALWEEVKHYAPVAIIKEMGGFDTGVGAGVRDYILAEEYSGVGNKVKAFFKDSQYRDDAFGFLPGYMDEVGWITIWNAAKKQSAAMNPNMDAEEQMRAAANIFTRAVTETQVYDSVFSRSGLMRSKDTGLQMATAFMAEPTVTINMIADALVAHRRGQRKVVGRTLGSILLSTVANAACAALVYAARDDDDDETYTEKYTEAFLSKVMEGLNIMTYIPIARDLMSLVQGYDIERADMAVAADLVKATQAMFSPKVPVAKKLTDFAGSVSSMFGLPTKNILRDLKAVWNVFTIDPGKTTSAGMARAVKAAMLPSWLGFKPEKNDARLYKAVMSGDQEEIRRSMAEFKTEEAAHSALRSQLRENDDRIKKAAELKLAGDAKGFRALFKEIQNEGNFEFDDIMKAINSEVSELKPETEPKAADPKKQAFYEKYGYTWSQKGDLYDAGGISDSELIQAYVDVEGRTREAATERVTVMHFQKIHPQAEDISYAAIEDFNTFCEPAGVSFDEFWDVKKYYNGIDGPKKEIVMEYINGLPISYEAKTALYFAMGWKESTLDEAPWY